MLSLEELITYAIENNGQLFNASLISCGATYALETAYEGSDTTTTSLSAKMLQLKELQDKAAIRQMLSCIEISSDEELEQAQELIITRGNIINKKNPIKVKIYKHRGKKQ